MNPLPTHVVVWGVWPLKAIAVAVALALLTDKKRAAEPKLQIAPKRKDPQSQELHRRIQLLWHQSFLLAREVSPEHGLLGLFAEAGFAAAHASIRPTKELDQAAKVVTGIRGTSSGKLLQLSRKLRTSPPQPETWAPILGQWLKEQYPAGKDPTVVGWPLATFGLNYWGKGDVSYLRGGQELPLPRPFSVRDSLEFLGPFRTPKSSAPKRKLQRLTLCDGAETAGLERPRLWALEGLLGAVPGVTLTELGHMHRQYPSPRQPEWLESLTAVYDPREVQDTTILRAFWEGLARDSLVSYGQLIHVFASQEQQRAAATAWKQWRDRDSPQQPGALLQRQVTWFDPAKPSEHKSHLREVKILSKAFSEVDLAKSPLATKVNGFAAGFGKDQDVVVAAARYGLDQESTCTLRLIRYLASRL